jgi:hypothetical protein
MRSSIELLAVPLTDDGSDPTQHKYPGVSRTQSACATKFLFVSMADAGDRIEAWRIDNDELRPYSSLVNLIPTA